MGVVDSGTYEEAEKKKVINWMDTVIHERYKGNWSNEQGWSRILLGWVVIQMFGIQLEEFLKIMWSVGESG